MSDNINVLLVGTGNMAREYYRVLENLNVEVSVIGRGAEKAEEFEKITGIRPILGGLNSAVGSLSFIPTHAIIAVGVDQLTCVAETAIKSGIKNILLEKPGGLYYRDVEKLSKLAEKNKVNVYVAYNRRFYSSVEKAREIIARDGGVQSFHFEFTEWSDVIERLEHRQEIKEQWLYANSSHVIDLAFFLGGKPQKKVSFQKGQMSWHKKGSAFSGAGISEKGAIFSYHANWDAPGRWSVEVLTRKHRLYLKPMEKLQIQNLHSVNIETIPIDNELDIKYKPGLFKEVKAFLYGEDIKDLPSIEEQQVNWRIYEQIEAGTEI